jgi:Holliday junction resolvase RusA-like endonuclease
MENLAQPPPYTFEEIYRVFIPYNTPSSKNGRVWTGKNLIASKAVQNWRKNTRNFWKEYKDSFLKAIEIHNLKYPYHIEFKFVRGSKHKFDYVNPLQTVLDEMVTLGWIEDDNADVIKPSFGDYEYNKINPGVYITVLKNKD